MAKVVQFTARSYHGNTISNIQRLQILGHFPTLWIFWILSSPINFDYKISCACLKHVGDRCIASGTLLPIYVNDKLNMCTQRTAKSKTIGQLEFK